MTLVIVPTTLDEANLFVERHHRHSVPPRGHKFSIACADGDRVVGVGIVGRPIARALEDGWTLEALRVCTDGTPNACSKIYAASWRATRALGYRKLITYTLKTEPWQQSARRWLEDRRRGHKTQLGHAIAAASRPRRTPGAFPMGDRRMIPSPGALQCAPVAELNVSHRRHITRETPVHDFCRRVPKLGPSRHMPDHASPDRAILRTLTFDPEPPDNLVVLDATRACEGGYCCACAGCELERQRRLRAGVRGSRQPWQNRRAA